jgi:hypothetical protein
MVAPFQPHGAFKVRLDGRIIVSDVTGPWNREAVRDWVREIHKVAVVLNASGPHVGLALVRESLLCPPDALAAMGQAIAYATANLQCVGNGIVADATVEGRELLQGTYARIYEGTAPHRFFHDIEGAKLWALQLLAQHGA